MYNFGKTSKARLDTCHQDLQDIMNDLIKVMDVTIIQGWRTPEQHAEYLRKGYSTVPYERSKHSSKPSRAVDVAPYPVDWDDIQRFKDMMNVIKGSAAARGIDIRCGGDWESFKDYPHIELVGK